MSWTPERIDELTKLWESGHSASAIGKLLGVSKNAVVGKAHRMKLQARPSPIKRGEEGKASGSASSAKAAVKQSPKGAKSLPSGHSIAAGSKGAAKNEPLQSVISAARAAKSAGSAAASAAQKAVAAERGTKTASGAQTATQAVSAAKAVQSGAKRSVASATRAVGASRRGPKCLWPIGDPGDEDFHFCGEPAQPGKPYCTVHCARAYITRSRSDSAAA